MSAQDVKTQGIRVFHSRRYFADLGEHIMPIRKFGLVRDAIARYGLPVRLNEPEPATNVDLLRVHSAAYIRAMDTGEPRSLAESQKFPWSASLSEAVRWTNGGTLEALDAALEDGIAGNLASGFHHAHAEHGEGFCTYNGLVVAMERARVQGRIRRALVLDMDLHYGNGTASLLASRPDFHQLSIYGNWYEKNLAHRDVNAGSAPDTANCRAVPVPAGTKGEAYKALLAAELGPAIDRARPDVVLYQAGADPYKEDPYSPLDLEVEDLKARDRLVFDTCKQKGIPVMWVLAGGYTPDITKVVQVHLNTFLAAWAAFRK